MNQSIILQLDRITKTFPHQVGSANKGDRLKVLDNISLTLERGELLGLLGPSGCGKTTLLRVIAGFESISAGSVAIAGKIVCSKNEFLAAEKRNTGMVFQDYALFPHLTVAENIAFGLKSPNKHYFKGVFSSKTNGRIKSRVKEVLELVGLRGLEQRYPHQLSGGQQQRISLARALAPQPALILLDEPLSNLDVQVRHRLRAEIRSILKAAGTSAVFVTHDREEALAISDRIAVMRQGKIEQMGTPESVYLNPASLFVAEFVTQANILPATKKGGSWQTEIGEITVSATESADDNYREIERANLTIRPENIRLNLDPSSEAVVIERQFLGREYYYCVLTAAGKRIYVRSDLEGAISIGTKVSFALDFACPKIFPLSNAKKTLASVSL